MRKNSKVAEDISQGAIRVRSHLESVGADDRAVVRALAGFVYHQCIGDNEIYRKLFNNPEFAPKMIATRVYKALLDTRDKNCLRPTRAGTRRTKAPDRAPSFIEEHLDRLRTATELWAYTCGIRLNGDARADMQRAWAALDVDEERLGKAFEGLRDVEARNESLGGARKSAPREFRDTDDDQWRAWCAFRPLFT